ncbi:hypothetical protein LMG29542_00484 [Paraburkholderia humisilvae]|uniref:Uncharacterized protein n=1 Tax=Paraburkholderia humisilvae TaxID=627669 RepID=A0A6J5D2Q8_9BURK|nr:hypothetical protein LMG29542_00484 [Paraburkholderia humisilvae]
MHAAPIAMPLPGNRKERWVLCFESFNIVRVQSQSYPGTCYNSGFI